MRVSENVRPTSPPDVVLMNSIPPWYPGDHRSCFLFGLPRCRLPGMSLDGPGAVKLTDSYPEVWLLNELLDSHPIWRQWVAASPLELCEL